MLAVSTAPELMMEPPLNLSHFQLVQRAIEYLVSEREQQPSLEQLAQHVGSSPFHLQRLFVAHAGVSPKELLQAMTLQDAKRWLRQSSSTLDTSYAVGLSSTSRLHELFLSVESVSPGEYQRAGAGLTLHWGIFPSLLGPMLLASSPRGLCHASFIEAEESPIALLQHEWPQAQLLHDEAALQATASNLQQRLSGRQPEQRLGILMKGSPFRLQVWQALMRVPVGQTCSYSDLARMIGQPQASRAVAQSVANNALAVLIPCHRVIRQSGELGGYRWGSSRKAALLALERARQDHAELAV